MKFSLAQDHMFKVLFTAAFSFALSNCGMLSDKSDDQNGGNSEDVVDVEEDNASAALTCGESSHDASVSEIKLKSLSQITRFISDVWGPGSLVDISDSSRNIFDTYGAQYPSKAGTGIDALVADTLSTTETVSGLIMAHTIVGRNIGLYCSTKVGQEGKCKCDDEASAVAVLNRALPFYRACEGTDDKVVAAFVSLCKDDQFAAVSALASSLPILMR